MTVITITNEFHLQTELTNAGSRLVVADFTAAWCMPCQRIAPVFERLATQYTQVVFLKIDVDRCQSSAETHGISSMPTFIFFKNRIKIDRLQGANPALLEDKIKQLCGPVEASTSQETGVAGHVDLLPFVMKAECEALNICDEHNFNHCLTLDGGYLQSDCDEQLILAFSFSQAVKIHSIKVKAPAENGPKTLRIFINQPNTLDFDSANSNQAVQELTLTLKDLEGTPVNLRFVKFQNVQNFQIFVKDNQGGTEVTQIDYLQLIGSPIITTNMSDFKRVTGKKGEAH